MFEPIHSLPSPARVLEYVQETHSVFTLRLEFCEASCRAEYAFEPGQFNMLYLYGVGEVPISIVSDPQDAHVLDHTIRAVGRITRGLKQLQANDTIGIRGPFGRGWPMQEARGRDVLVITGGLGCAPVVSVINYIMQRRSEFGRLSILQGVKLPRDLIWRQRYEQWIQQPDTQVLLAADRAAENWPWHVGLVTELFDQVNIDNNTLVMMCGPEIMMRVCMRELQGRGIEESNVYLSMERNMKCALGHCGRCQYGHHFICRDGPVFSYPVIKPYFAKEGF